MSRMTNETETLPIDEFSQSYDRAALHPMRSIPKSPQQVDDFLHPLWLGILILLHTIALIGLLYCLRRKCGSRLGHFAKGTGIRRGETSLSSHHTCECPPKDRCRSPKLYTLVQNMRKSLPSKEDACHQDKIHAIAESRHPQVEQHTSSQTSHRRVSIDLGLVEHYVRSRSKVLRRHAPRKPEPSIPVFEQLHRWCFVCRRGCIIQHR